MHDVSNDAEFSTRRTSRTQDSRFAEAPCRDDAEEPSRPKDACACACHACCMPRLGLYSTLTRRPGPPTKAMTFFLSANTDIPPAGEAWLSTRVRADNRRGQTCASSVAGPGTHALVHAMHVACPAWDYTARRPGERF